MNWQEFTEKTKETAVYPGHDKPRDESTAAIAYLALGLAGETGETVDVLKKQWRKAPEGHFPAWSDPAFLANVQLELGDVFWYAAQLISVLGLDFEEVLQANLDKLAQRKAAGTLKERHTSGGVVLAELSAVDRDLLRHARGGIVKGEGPVTAQDHTGFVVPQRQTPKAFFDALEGLNERDQKLSDQLGQIDVDDVVKLQEEELVDPAERDE